MQGAITISDADAEKWVPPIEVSAAIYMITPALAKRMLELSGKQRPLSAYKVLRMALRMTEDWIYTHQAIGFSNEQKLVDGQHRLHAIVESEVAHPFLVGFGLDPGAFKFIDTETGRTVSDLVTIIHGGPVPCIHKKTAIGRAMLIGMDPANISGITRNDQAEFVDWYLKVIEEFFTVFQKMPPWAATGSMVASFCNAVRGYDEWPGGHGARRVSDVFPHAARYAAQEWRGPDDPMKLLFLKMARMRNIDKRGASSETDRRDIYAYTTAVIRCCLNNETLSKVQMSSIEWGSKNDRGKRPHDRPYTGKKMGGPDAEAASNPGG